MPRNCRPVSFLTTKIYNKQCWQYFSPYVFAVHFFLYSLSFFFLNDLLYGHKRVFRHNLSSHLLFCRVDGQFAWTAAHVLVELNFISNGYHN